MAESASGDNEPPRWGQPINNLIERMRASASAATERVNENLEGALNELFDTLDEDKDGHISRHEFKGMSLHAWATLRAFTSCVTCLPKLPSLQDVPWIELEALEASVQQNFQNLESAMSHWTFWECVQTYIGCLIIVQLILGFLDNARYYVSLHCIRRFPEPDLSVPVPKAPKEEALRYDTPLRGWYEFSKMALFLGSGLALVRFMVTLGFLIAGLCFINMASYSHNRFWRVFCLTITRQCLWGMLFFLGYTCVNIEGRIADRKEVKLLVANHCAVLEIFVLYCLAFPSFVAAVEHLSLPFFGGMVKVSNAILVDRRDPESKRKTLETIKQRAENPDSPQLMIFPEGTVSNHLCLFKFKVGPFVPKQPVQPVLFKFPYRQFNPSWTGEAVGGPTGFMLLVRTLCQFVNRLEVKILPVYHPSAEEVADANLYTNNVENLMAAHLGVPRSDASLEDYNIAQKRWYDALEASKNLDGYYNIAEVKKRMQELGAGVSRLRRPSSFGSVPIAHLLGRRGDSGESPVESSSRCSNGASSSKLKGSASDNKKKLESKAD